MARSQSRAREYIKHYGLHRKSVSQQMGRSRHAVMSKLAKVVVSLRCVDPVHAKC